MKTKASSCSQLETVPPPKNTGLPLSGEKVDMETSFMAVNAINEDVLPVASSLQIDVDMTTDTQDEAALSSPPAIFHHPNEGDVNIKGGGSLMGAAQLLPKILKPVLDPQITGTYAEGDPFLAKLQEIDRDLQKFDHVPYEKKECARNQQSAQLSQIEGCQIGELGSLGFETDEYLKCTDSEITKVSNGPEGKGKIGLGPGPQKDMKKGQWTRITKRLNYDLGVEVSYGADGLKRKDRENQAPIFITVLHNGSDETVLLNSKIHRAEWPHVMMRDLIEKGSFWRNGNGKSVQIYKDAWLPSLDGRLNSPVMQLAPESTVDSLINSKSGLWDTNLIDLCFYPLDALLIKSLPLCSSPQPDTLVWRSELSGCYSVKSGYKLLCELLLPDMNRPPVLDSIRSF
nr:hypothetical protein CFP56_16045 [Quercus suber]